jgi:hypothetical protein
MLLASLFTIAFAGQRLFDAESLARLQIEGVPFDFADDILLHDLSLEAAERVLDRLAFLEPDFSQMAPQSCTGFSGVVIRPLAAPEWSPEFDKPS